MVGSRSVLDNNGERAEPPRVGLHCHRDIPSASFSSLVTCVRRPTTHLQLRFQRPWVVPAFRTVLSESVYNMFVSKRSQITPATRYSVPCDS